MSEREFSELEKEITLDFLTFVDSVILQDQTALVIALLKGEKGDELEKTIINIISYEFTIGDGRVPVTTAFRKGFLKMWEEDYSRSNDLLASSKDEKEIKGLKSSLDWLKKDMEQMQQAKEMKKRVYQWILIPYWISETLARYGEVILRCHGCCWWGISSVLENHFRKDSILYDIFTELSYNKEHTHIFKQPLPKSAHEHE